MNAGTTNISDLPGSEITNSVGPIQLEQKELYQSPQQDSVIVNNNDIMSKLISGVQDAITQGLINLPQRDIPRDTLAHQTDPEAKPNYIPPAQNEDYISNQKKFEQIRQNPAVPVNLDSLYDDIQGPLMLAVLYFLFQLPIFKYTLYKYTSSMLFHSDGNYNIYGLIVVSGFFGFIYGGFMKFIAMV